MARSGRYRSRTWCACGPGSVAPTRSEQRAAADFAAVLEREGRSNAGPALRVALVEAVDAWLAELLGDVACDGALVASLRERALERWRATARERLEQLRAACQRRAERHGELAFLLEPDLKEARGALRDGHAVHAISATWVAAGLDHRGQAAYGLLLDARQALHLELLERGGGQVGRARAAVDRLSLQEQDAVAARLGQPGAEPLMRAVHEAGRTLARALDQSWRRVDARHAGPAAKRWTRPA